MLNLIAMILSLIGLYSYFAHASVTLLIIAGILSLILNLGRGVPFILLAALIGGLFAKDFWIGCFVVLAIGEAINAGIMLFFILLELITVNK